MNQGKIRIFIAITLPEAIIEKIEIIQAKLKKTGADVKWVKPTNIHLTLKFLGYIADGELSKVKDKLTKIAQEFSPFSVYIEGINGFPSMDNPRVIWIGISKGAELVKGINKAVEENLSKAGLLREERPFHPHLTLGRCRSAKHKDKLIKEMKEQSTFIGELKINKISIYKSTLTSQGPIYNRLGNAALGGGNYENAND